MIQKAIDKLEDTIKELQGVIEGLDVDHRDYEYYCGLLEGYENSLNILSNESY